MVRGTHAPMQIYHYFKSSNALLYTLILILNMGIVCLILTYILSHETDIEVENMTIGLH